MIPGFSGYFAHRSRLTQPGTPDLKRISAIVLLTRIRAIHAEVRQEYGSPRMWRELQHRGLRVGRERVRHTMQQHGIQARGKRKFATRREAMDEVIDWLMFYSHRRLHSTLDTSARCNSRKTGGRRSHNAPQIDAAKRYGKQG